MRYPYVLRYEFLSADIPFRQAFIPFREKAADAGKMQTTADKKCINPKRKEQFKAGK